MRKYIIIIASLSFFFSTCNDEKFLEKQPHSLTDADYYTSVNGAIAGLNAAYDILQWGEGVQRNELPGTSCSGDAMIGGQPGGTDRSELQDAMKFRMFPNNIAATSMWTFMYRGIYRCNIILQYLQDESVELELGFSTDLKNKIVGQALFLRGLYHFKLQIRYGGFNDLVQSHFSEPLMGVPFIDKVLPPDEWQQERPTVEETWDKIEADFIEAATLLPAKDEWPTADAGRATSGAALAMLAKTHLYQEEWQEAYDAALQVINSGKYHLIGSDEDPGPFTVTRLTKNDLEEVQMVGYKYIFQPEANNSAESIFDYQHFQQGSSTYPQGQEGNLLPQYYGPRQVWTYNNAGELRSQSYFWGFMLPTDYFINTAYEDVGCEMPDGSIVDPRFKLSVVMEGDSMPYYYSNETLRETYPDSVIYDSWFNWPCTGRCTWKYFTDPLWSTNLQTLGDHPQNYKYMRYADLLLIGAEAGMHLGGAEQANALAWINKVRERARNSGNTNYPQPYTAGELTLEAIWAERRVELAFENHQWFDVVRTGRAQAVLDEGMQWPTVTNPTNAEVADQQFGYNFEQGKHEIWPVPETEIDNSGGVLQQNPGY